MAFSLNTTAFNDVISSLATFTAKLQIIVKYITVATSLVIVPFIHLVANESCGDYAFYTYMAIFCLSLE